MTGISDKKPWRKRVLFILLLLGTSLASYIYWIQYEKPVIGIDDANIYFVYMRNLAHGNGLVYNIGGEHTEGFTSILWVCIGAFFYLFTSTPEILLLFLNIIIVTYTLYCICLFIDGYLEDKRLVSPYGLLLISTLFFIPGYIEWTILSLMETGIWSCLLTLISLYLCKSYLQHNIKPLRFYFLLVMLLLTRPESYVWGIFFLTVHYIILSRVYLRKRRLAITKSLPAVAIFMGGVLALTIFRLSYFGYPLPNTYYAKVSTNMADNFYEGFKYLGNFFYFYGLHLYAFIGAVICIIVYALMHKKNGVLYILTGAVITSFAVILYTGGDHFKLFRFIQPTVPIMVMLYILSLFTLLKLKKNIYYLPAILSSLLLYTSCRIKFHSCIKKNYSILHEFKIANGGRMFGNQLNTFWAYNSFYPTQGVHTCGGIAYTYLGNTNDILGLNNPAMAHADAEKKGIKGHSSFNKEIFYQQKPDLFFDTRLFRDTTGFIPPEISGEYNNEWITLLYKDILHDEKFKQLYHPVFIISKKSEFMLLTYTHQDFLNKLNTKVYSYCFIPTAGK